MLRFVKRPLLSPGMVGTDGRDTFILIAPDLSPEQEAITLWHELIHVIKASDPEHVHNEQEIEDLAEKLAATCPEVIDWVKYQDGI